MIFLDLGVYVRLKSDESGGSGNNNNNNNISNNNNNNGINSSSSSSSNGNNLPMDKDEKRMRREIANSNERRRMQSINAGFQSLRQMLPHHEGEKLSKVCLY
uniref:BHLH domain-containing protein n=1 Tax=Anopheles christyi TaxID=43041 RepID=A0A182KDC6_9DIPT